MSAKMIIKIGLDRRSYSRAAVPVGSKLLSVQNQAGKLQAWFLAPVGRDIPPKIHKFNVIETGEVVDIPDNWVFIATVQFDGGAYVVHVFEEP